MFLKALKFLATIVVCYNKQIDFKVVGCVTSFNATHLSNYYAFFFSPLCFKPTLLTLVA